MNSRRRRGARHIIGPITPAAMPIRPATTHPVAYHAPNPSTGPRAIMTSVSFVDDDISMRVARARKSRNWACLSRLGRFRRPTITVNRPTPPSAPKSTAASATIAAYPARSAGAGWAGAAGRAGAGGAWAGAVGR